MHLKDMQDEVLVLNTDKGWYEQERSVGDDAALLHSEVTEFFEAWRKDKGYDEIEGELADILIRLCDTATRQGVDLEGAFDRKMEINWARPHRHGGRKV